MRAVRNLLLLVPAGLSLSCTNDQGLNELRFENVAVATGDFDRIEEALARNIPILGICRGAQMLNVALGGTLDQDAWQTFGRESEIRTILPRRRIDVLDDTHLARIAGQADMDVNALHSQAVNRLGDGLRVSARDENGMIQAVERIRDPFAIGVQWHPEHLFYARRQRAIFRALVVAARARAEARNQAAAVREDALGPA
mgnify:CR=1 FL=1